ncbi:hypothetical protein FUAX_13640 [Fulvitalea axinellae]|uniref:Uncharacterized protein n=1 Tax=Fulvitalea axinellae TaxID=1182444 RepID=A0AAU9CU19_9BACT|nr:hypothetical protein FUAX_13640 [Fulvitalea axinellae]
MIRRTILSLALGLGIAFASYGQSAQKEGEIVYEGKKISTVAPNSTRFLGKYKGKKSGFLQLNADGSGKFKYDFVVGKNCSSEAFDIEWGFIKGDDGKPVKFKREYGHSYPIFYVSKSGKQFKGCREEVFLDWLLVKKDGIHVSSSDDWKRQSPNAL